MISGLEWIWLGPFVILLAYWGLNARRAAFGLGRYMGPWDYAFLLALVLALGITSWVAGHVTIASGEKALEAARAGRTAPQDAASPARARLFLNSVSLAVPQRKLDESVSLTVGYSPEADLQLPHLYGLPEAQRNDDVFHIEFPAGEGRALRITTPDQSGASSRIIWHTVPKEEARFVLPTLTLPDSRMAQEAFDLLGENPCQRDSRELSRPVDSTQNVHIILLCDAIGGRRALFVIDRSVPPRSRAGAQSTDATPLRIRPFWWAGRWTRHHIPVDSGMLIYLGVPEQALPGMRSWAVPTPRGAGLTVFPPYNPLADCADWTRNNDAPAAGFILPDSGGYVTPVRNRSASGFACALDFVAPFGLEVRRIVPLSKTLDMYVATVNALILGPLLIVLFATLILVRRSTLDRWVALAGQSVLAAFTANALTWRALWAHRIDMLRDYEVAGSNVDLNTNLTWLIAASLAAIHGAWLAETATSRRSSSEVRGIVTAAVVWTLVVAIGSHLVDFPDTARELLQVGFSGALVALGPIWRLALRLSSPTDDAFSGRTTFVGFIQNHTSFSAVAAASGVVAFFHFFFQFLGLSSIPIRFAGVLSLGPLLYLVLSQVLEYRPGDRNWSVFAVVLWVGLAGLLASYDFGLTAVVGLPSALLGLGMVLWDEAMTAHVGRRATLQEWLPLLIVACLAPGLVWIAQQGRDGAADFPRRFTEFAFCVASIALIVFFAIASAVRFVISFPKRRRTFSFLSAGSALACVFTLLVFSYAISHGEDVLQRAFEPNRVFSHRLGVIFEPAYALLYGENAFAASLSSWAETASGRGADAPGYFGAQIRDPGTSYSIDNDYLAVLILRELGARHLTLLSLAFLLVCAGGFAFGAVSLGASQGSRSARRILVATLGVACVYQPLGALGIVPFTGISWPLLGIDSPSDYWIWVAPLFFACAWSDHPPSGTRDPRRGGTAIRFSTILISVMGVFTGVLLVNGAANFATNREPPVKDGILAKVFGKLPDVQRFVRQYQCAPRAVGGTPDDVEIQKPILETNDPDKFLDGYARKLSKTWEKEQFRLHDGISLLWLDESTGCDDIKKVFDGSHWSAESLDDGKRCRLTFKYGWPRYQLVMPSKRPTIEPSSESGECIPAEGTVCDISEVVFCEVLEDERFSDPLPLKPRHPYRGARVRLVSRAMGDTTRDLGELIAHDMVIRVRPNADPLKVTPAHGGPWSSSNIVLADRIRIEIDEDGGEQVAIATLVTDRERPKSPWELVLLRKAGGGAGRWDSEVLRAGQRLTLDRTAIFPLGGTPGARTWLFRPRSASFDGRLIVDPMLADDLVPVSGAPRRRYLYGSVTPELGWRSSTGGIGLDAWVAASVRTISSEVSGTRSGAPGVSSRGHDPKLSTTFISRSCGTLTPDPIDFADVCQESPLDGVLECRVSVQPELQSRLNSLLEITSLTPWRDARGRKKLPWKSSYALLRGDTGEILAHGEFVPGRESSSLAPRRTTVETYLIDALDSREETGTVRAEWTQPIALGSTLKAIFARAGQATAPDLYEKIRFARGQNNVTATCGNSRRPWFPLLGHCAPTRTVWNLAPEVFDTTGFLTYSPNWFQVGLGLLGPALPDGVVDFGNGRKPEPLGVAIERGTIRLASETKVALKSGGRKVLDGTHVDAGALRGTGFWRRIETIVGRPLCLDSKAACLRRHSFRDLCAARALPLPSVSATLRRLVATGHGHFDFAEGASSNSVREYMQLLRGSGKHEIASTLQLADAYNRIFYGSERPGGSYALASSWFPSPPVGRFPTICRSHGLENATGSDSVARGLCGVLTSGTAKEFKTKLGVLDRDDIVFFGAKTGTINSLAFLLEGKQVRCYQANLNHTVPDLPSEVQPLHLDCLDRPSARAQMSDRLFVIGFAVRQTSDGDAETPYLPLTLALRYQHAAEISVSELSWDFIRVAADYLDGRTSN